MFLARGFALVTVFCAITLEINVDKTFTFTYEINNTSLKLGSNKRFKVNREKAFLGF